MLIQNDPYFAKSAIVQETLVLMDLKEILKKLYEGRRLKLSFASAKEREQFRIRLYKIKQREDKVLTDILDEDRQVLKCQFIDVVETDGVTLSTPIIDAIFWLEKKPIQEFEVTDITDPKDATQV